jgi:hypothetical protein
VATALHRSWRRLRHRVRSHARHTDTVFHPAVNYTVIAVVILMTVAAVAYALTVR